MPKHAVFECSAVCLSVIIKLLPGLIPFTFKWHAELILDKKQYLQDKLLFSDYNLHV